MNEARLIIADDHQVVRQGLRQMLERVPGFSVVGEAADGAEAEHLAHELPADLLILDIALPVKRGIKVLESLRAAGSHLPVLLFTMCPADQYVGYARRHGAQGFVGKDASESELVGAIHCILNGGTQFPSFKESEQDAGNPFESLSARETEVMHGLLEGEPLADIAARLGVSVKSINTYRRRLLDKLGVRSNAELAVLHARQFER